VQTLTISAVSLESAQGFRDAMSEFMTELIETGNGRYHVKVTLAGNERSILAALRTLENYVIERGNGPVSLELEGHKYRMEPST
jgi:hypothetical protein